MKLGKIYREKQLQSQGVYDKKTLTLELMKDPFKTPTPLEVLLLVRLWNA